MRRMTLILLTLFAFACVSLAQKSGGSSAGSSNGGASAGTMSSGGAVGATAAAPTTDQQPPMAPANPATVSPGNPNATTGGSPLVPGSAVPTANSNQQLNTFTGAGNAGVGVTGGVGQVAPSFHLETELPPPGVTENGTGSPAGVTNGGSPGNSSPTSGSVAVYDVAGRGANPNNGATSGPEIVDVAGDLAGMTYVSGNAPAPQQAEDTRTLGEIAAQYKRNRSVQAAHVYTNEDIDRLNARNDSGVMGANQNVALPEGEGAPAQQQQQPAVKRNQKRSPFTPQRPK